MKDRIPTKPNRYAVYDDAHNFLRYEYHERADEPTQIGTALAKANLLSDATATLFGLGSEAVPDDVLSAIKLLISAKGTIESSSYVGTGVYGNTNKNTLTFQFVPKLLIVAKSGRLLPLYNSSIYATGFITSFIWMEGASSSSCYASDEQSGGALQTAVSGNTISWYTTVSASAQCNEPGASYSYIAIG